MIALKFKDFAQGNYSDYRYKLYVVRDETDVLYVGISEWSIYERWFGNGFTHIGFGITGEPYGQSAIGEAIIDNLPRSLDWVVELWTEKQCFKFLKSEMPKEIRDVANLRELEVYMIHRRQPVYNSTHNQGNPKARYYSHFSEDELDKAYDEIFNKRQNLGRS